MITEPQSCPICEAGRLKPLQMHFCDTCGVECLTGSDARENVRHQLAYEQEGGSPTIRKSRKVACALTDAELADPEFVRAYIEGCNESFAEVTAELKTHRGMADCMDMVRGELIQAGIIDKSVPPMFIADAVCKKLSASEREARRYRFLRESAYIEIRGDFQRIDGWQPEKLDQSIDAALSGRASVEAE